MRDPDEAVERLLTGLRDAKPAADIQQHILAAMQHATASRESANAGRLRVPCLSGSQPALAMRMAGAAALVLVLLFILTGRQHRQASTRMSRSSERSDAIPLPRPRELAAGPSGEPRYPASEIHRKRMIIRAPSHHAFAEEVTASSNYPAPPLPLTEQERLLLRLARRRDPGSFTILNAEERGAQTALSTEQFRQFFGLNEQEMRTQLE